MMEDVMLRIKDSNLNKEFIREAEDYFGSDINHLYHFPARNFVPLCYYEDFIWQPLLHIDLDYIKMIRLKDFIKQRRMENQKWLEQGNFKRLFSMCEKAIKIGMYIKYFEQIPDEDKYDLFRYVYKQSEYNFTQFEEDFLIRVFSYREHSEEWRNSINELQPFTDENGMLTIYRGEGDLSTPIEDAMSWTLSKEVAMFFAKRFSSKGTCYKAKVYLQDIYDYLPERNEQEILVDFCSLENIKKLNT